MSATFAELAELLRYPSEERTRERPRPTHDDELDAFFSEVAAIDRGELEATYTSTFDLAPSCSPYVGVHLFGVEGPVRARLLVGLRAGYEKAGIDFDERELPDHVAEVLAFAAHEEIEERDEVVRFILVPALTKMNELLRSTANPYRHLIAAALRASEEAVLQTR